MQQNYLQIKKYLNIIIFAETTFKSDFLYFIKILWTVWAAWYRWYFTGFYMMVWWGMVEMI